jgi:hypothetical protein
MRLLHNSTLIVSCHYIQSAIFRAPTLLFSFLTLVRCIKDAVQASGGKA